MRQRFFLFFTLLIVGWLSASAYDFMVNGIAYNKNSDGNTVTVTYTRLYTSYNYNGGSGSLVIPEKVTCAGKTYTVTAIGNNAFWSCSGFTGSLTIPSSVTIIGNYAFRGCSGFTGSLTIPNSVTSIGDGAFSGCSGFTGSLTIPSSVTIIGESAFFGCSGFTGSLTIPSSVTKIGDAAFAYCSGFAEVISLNTTPPTIDCYEYRASTTFDGLHDKPLYVPAQNALSYMTNQDWGEFKSIYSISATGDSFLAAGNSFKIDNLRYIVNDDLNTVTVTYVEPYSPIMQDTHGSGSLVIPEKATNRSKEHSQEYTVSAIGNYAFSGCSGLTGSLTIPNSVTSIGNSAFSGCSGFTGSLTIPNSVTSIGNSAFSGCSGFTGSLTIPNSVTSIGNYAFSGCDGFTGPLVIPSSVTEIGYSAFSGCTGFTGSLTIPNSVTSIGGMAFFHCDGFTRSLTIGNSVTSIGNRAFEYCSEVTEITCLNPTPPTIGESTFEELYDKPLHVPTQSVSAYKDANYWKNFRLILPIIDIVDNYVTDIILDRNSITLEMREKCNLVATVLPEDATWKVVAWHSSNTAVATVDENGKVTAVAPGTATITATSTDGSNLSASCEVTVNEPRELNYIIDHNSRTATVTSSRNSSGENYKGLKTAYIPSSIIGDYELVFECNHGPDCNLHNDDHAVYKPVYYPVEIGDGAFVGCADLERVIISEGISTIGYNAFQGCSKLTEFELPASVRNIGEYALSYCENLEKITVASGNTVFDSANDCNAIIETATKTLVAGCKNTIIPNDIDEIGYAAFMGCSGLTSIAIPNSVTGIDGEAFAFSGLTGTLTIPGSVDGIGWAAFFGCSGVTEVHSLNTTPPTIVSDVFEYDLFDKPLHVPAQSVNAYKNADEWKNFKSISSFIDIYADSISLGNSTLTLDVNENRNLVATVLPEDATWKVVAWHSSNTAVATVDENGMVTAVAPGTATITATTTDGSNLSASCQVTVLFIAKSISLNKTSLKLNDGQSETLTATVTPANATIKQLMWESSDPTIAAVDASGKVTAVGPGTANITVSTTDGSNLSATCQVTVEMKAKAITLNMTTLELIDSQSETLVATVSPSNTSNKEVTWESSNTGIVTVDENGKVTGVWPGTATITATTTDGTDLSASCLVTYSKTTTFEYKGLMFTINDDFETAHVTYQLYDDANNYKGMSEVTIPETVSDKQGTYTVTGIGDYAFNNCSSLKSVKYASSVSSIGKHAFENCSSLKQVIIPETVTSIGDNPFARCNNLQSISVSRFNPNYDSRDYCNAIISKADNRLISGCTYTIIPESVTTIGRYAFEGMYNLKSITIPSTVTTLDDYAFKGCSGLTTIVIPANVTRVGSKAFTECTGLIEVFCLGKVPPTTADNTYVTFAQSIYDRTPLRVRRSCIDAYKTTGSWKGFAHIEGIDGYLYAGNCKFFSGDSFTVPVELINDTEITGIQVDVKMPEGISVAMDSEDYPMVFLTDRKSRTHGIMANYVDASTLRILSTSSNNRPFTGSEGELFNITFKTAPTLSAGMHTVQFKNIEISPCDGAKLLPADMDLAFYAYYIPGDANHDHRVSIADPVVASSYILARNPDPFHFLSADVNEDKAVSVSDVVLIGNIILGAYTTPDIKFATPRMRGSNELSASVVESRGDGTRTIAIALDNSTDYTAFQADLQLPQGMKVTGARLTGRAGRHHSLDMNMVDDNTVRLISFAGDNSLFEGNSGDLLLIDVKGRGDINVTNALFCEPNGCEHELNEITIFTELSGINDITVGDNAPVNVYNTAGQLIRTNVDPATATQGLTPGFYIVGDKKVVVK